MKDTNDWEVELDKFFKDRLFDKNVSRNNLLSLVYFIRQELSKRDEEHKKELREAIDETYLQSNDDATVNPIYFLSIREKSMEKLYSKYGLGVENEKM